MKIYILLSSAILSSALLLISTGFAQSSSEAVNSLLQHYSIQGVLAADAEQGKRLWLQTFPGDAPFRERSCTSCHSTDLSATGQHVKTRKVIKPMAPSLEPKRLTEGKKIEKWFRRNCKWTMGRECSAQEKANLLAYLSQQTDI